MGAHCDATSLPFPFRPYRERVLAIPETKEWRECSCCVASRSAGRPSLVSSRPLGAALEFQTGQISFGAFVSQL